MSKKKKLKYADAIIAICVFMCIIITACVLYEYHRLDTVISSGVLAALVSMWTGELMLCAVRQIFGSDVIKQAKGKGEEYP